MRAGWVEKEQEDPLEWYQVGDRGTRKNRLFYRPKSCITKDLGNRSKVASHPVAVEFPVSNPWQDKDLERLRALPPRGHRRPPGPPDLQPWVAPTPGAGAG